MGNYNELAKMIVSKRNFNVVQRFKYDGGLNLIELATTTIGLFMRIV